MRQEATTQVPSEFAPTTGGTESTSAGAMLVYAYLLMWIVLMVFVGMSWRRQRATTERLRRIEAALDRTAGSD